MELNAAIYSDDRSLCAVNMLPDIILIVSNHN